MSNPPGVDARHTLRINRAPVFTLWAAVVAQRLGFDRDEAVTLGRAVAGMNAATKARALGRTKPRDETAKTKPRSTAGVIEVPLCNRLVPAVRTPEGVRAVAGGKPTDPASAHRYLESKFGDALDDVRGAMSTLAKSLTKDELDARAFELYEAFRPAIPAGARGWGAKGVLDLDRIRGLAAKGRARG